MGASILQHTAPPEQLRQFEDEGYLVVENALPSDVVDHLEEIVDRIDAAEHKCRCLSPAALMAKFNVVVEDDFFFELLDWPKTFPIVWDILGWNIQLYISHLIGLEELATNRPESLEPIHSWNTFRNSTAD